MIKRLLEKYVLLICKLLVDNSEVTSGRKTEIEQLQGVYTARQEYQIRRRLESESERKTGEEVDK